MDGVTIFLDANEPAIGSQNKWGAPW